MTREQIEQYLIENCTVSTPEGAAEGTGLKEIWSSLFNDGKTKNIKKADAARDLARWYANSQNIVDIWNGGSAGFLDYVGLHKAEKEFISVYVQYGGKEFVPATKAIAEEHEITPPEEKRSYYWGSRDFYDTSGYGIKHLRFLHLCINQYPDTKAVYFFPGGKKMPPFVLSTLQKIIPPMEFEYPEFAPEPSDRLICRESRVGDIAAVVRFVGSEQVKMKADGFDITKAKLAKMAQVIGFEEVCDNNGKFSTPKEAKRANDFKVALPLFLLVANSGLIYTGQDSRAQPSEKAVGFLAKPLQEVARNLFKDYLQSQTICETHYITYITIYDGEHAMPWSKIRRPIIDLLTTCPVGQFVKYSDFEKYAMIFHGGFFRDHTNCAIYVRGINSSYYNSYTPDWDECEAQIIRLILSFCGALGMLDIVYTEGVKGFKQAKNDLRVGISGFRINPLGAWILGLADAYDALPSEAQAADGDFIVQPDHTVIISGLKNRVEHETFLSKFLTKASVDENVSIYRIDFSGMVKAFSQNTTPAQLKAYLQKASGRPLPENVKRSFDDWQAKVGRVRIRSVTILEADDELLLQELVHIGGMDKYASDILENAVVIDDDAPKKVKALAEKNGWLVEI